MLWYVSKEKLDILKEDTWSFWPKSLQVTLKEPFTGSEVGMNQTTTDDLLKDLEKVKRTLAKKDIPAFHEIADSPAPMLCTFDGRAARIAEETGFWVALAETDAALLLAGSTANTIGKHSISGRVISPSVDPINAIRRAFRDESDEDDMTLVRKLSYAWQAVWRSLDGALAVPSVRGIAVVAGIYKANKAEMRRAGMQSIDRLIVGSPVFVEQLAD